MVIKVKKSGINGKAVIPGSKSHTIRALFFASLAKGRSYIRDPLYSDDSYSAQSVLKGLGSTIVQYSDHITVDGFGNTPAPVTGILDVGNSGTTLRLAASVCALSNKPVTLTGDAQIRKRPVKPLIDALSSLGAKTSFAGAGAYPPVTISGPVKGGMISIECVTSQYLSSLLITLPLVSGDSVIIPTVLNERPYVNMTLWWLDKAGIKYKRKGYERFEITGGQQYSQFDARIPGDFSSAAFPIVMAAISGGTVSLYNLEMDDPQGDKALLDIVSEMGAQVIYHEDHITVTGRGLRGREIDLNAMPDALPALSVLGCFAVGQTKLYNVPQARLKETDRIKVMHDELIKMGADITELEDGLIIKESRLKSCHLNGHFDHRVVMALSLAGAMCEGETVIDTAEAVNITFPEYVRIMRSLGLDMEMI